MALRIRTVKTYQLDGSTEFIIPFEYLARKFVTVTLIGQDRKELILNQDFRFVEKTKVQTTRTWTPSDGYNLIEVRRYTSATERLVDFADGSILRAYDLNISQVQTLHVAEEARDLTADTIGVNNDGNLDARGRRIVNVADAVSPGDAVNLGQLQKWNDSALNSANKALNSANKAEQQANAAAASASQAKDSQAAANNSAAYANNRAIDSDSSAKASQQHANMSATSASESAQSERLAKLWASAGKNVEIQGGMGSAYHYMLYSQDYSVTSKNEADRSTREADRAKTEADKLGNMNDIAFAIEKVSDNINVWWKGQAVFRNAIHLRNESNTANYLAGYKSTGVIDWAVGRVDADDKLMLTKDGAGEITFNKTTLAITRSNSKIFMSDNAAEFNSPNVTVNGTVRFRSLAKTGPHSVIIHGNEGGDSGLNSLNITTETGGPGTQINGLRGAWYTSGWAFVARSGSSTDLPSVGLTVTNAGQDSADYSFGYDGRISVDRGYTLARNGNIFGQVWGGGWLSDWLKATFVGSISYGAYTKLGWNQGWTDLMSPKGHTQIGTNVSDKGLVAAIYVAPLYQNFHNGVTRLVDTGW